MHPCRLPSVSTVGIVVVLVVGVVGSVRSRRANVDWPLSLYAVNVVAASKHIGRCGFTAVAGRPGCAGGAGVSAIGAEAMGPAVVEGHTVVAVVVVVVVVVAAVVVAVVVVVVVCVVVCVVVVAVVVVPVAESFSCLEGFMGW